jgi:hypothetical protein
LVSLDGNRNNLLGNGSSKLVWLVGWDLLEASVLENAAE